MARKTRRVREPEPDLTDPKRFPHKAYAPNGMTYAMVRIRLADSDPPKYYNSNNNGRDNIWVAVGYTTWSLIEWNAKYGEDYRHGDTRNWDFFGDPIDIWENYSDE